MKVLQVSHTVYDQGFEKLAKNKSGFNLMIRDIVESISQHVDTFLITCQITKEFSIGNCLVLSHTWKNIIFNIKLRHIFNAIHVAFCVSQGFKHRVRYGYYALNMGYAEKIIKKVKPDIVHIHGAGYFTDLWIDLCQKNGIKCMITLHGLLEFDSKATKDLVNRESKLLKYASEHDIPVTVISTGMLSRLRNGYVHGLNLPQNLYVVPNGTNIKSLKSYKLDIYEKYNINKNKKIMVCVGNILVGKNQTQLVRAFALLDAIIRNDLVLLLIGKTSPSIGLEKLIQSLDLSEQIKICGYIDPMNMSSYFYAANYNVLVSLHEGFGLSIIEGFVYGLPCLVFSDLDAVPDLYHECAMITVDERSDQALAKGIEKLTKRDWDKNEIMKHSLKFSLTEMSKRYVNIYEKLFE